MGSPAERRKSNLSRKSEKSYIAAGVSVGTAESSGVEVGVSAGGIAVSVGLEVEVSAGTAVLVGSAVGVSVDGAGVKVAVSVVVAVEVGLSVGTGVLASVTKLSVALWAMMTPTPFMFWTL